MNRQFVLGITLCFSHGAWAAIKKQSVYVHERKPIIVAIVDTGADIYHPDLKDYIWKNPGELGKDSSGNDKENNGIDDDDNGYVDDFQGWNFVDHSNRVRDDQGHGTHIAGIIKNEALNRSADNTSSTSPAVVRLMILKYYDPAASNRVNLDNSTKAIAYANQMHANIINYSGGGEASSVEEQNEIRKSNRLGILFVAAAGNEKSNTDYKSYYPASYRFSNMISVAASTDEGELVAFSNYGIQSVDIAAPGKSVISALPGRQYGPMSGTSQSTAFVAGAAARLMALRSYSLTPEQTKELLIKNARPNKSLKGKTKYQVALQKHW